MTSPPQTPIINTYEFHSAYYERPDASLSSYATPPLDDNSPTRSVFPPPPPPPLPPLFRSQQLRPREEEEEPWRALTPPLDMSVQTDTSTSSSSSLDEEESLFFPATPLLRHSQPNVRTQTPRSGDRILLQGLGIEGLFGSDSKPPFEGMGLGLLSRRLVGLEIEDEEEEERSEDDGGGASVPTSAPTSMSSQPPYPTAVRLSLPPLFHHQPPRAMRSKRQGPPRAGWNACQRDLANRVSSRRCGNLCSQVRRSGRPVLE